MIICISGARAYLRAARLASNDLAGMSLFQLLQNPSTITVLRRSVFGHGSMLDLHRSSAGGSPISFVDSSFGHTVNPTLFSEAKEFRGCSRCHFGAQVFSGWRRATFISTDALNGLEL